MTKLHTAAYNNEVNNLEKSLADFSINELESVTGETALHWAISGVLWMQLNFYWLKRLTFIKSQLYPDIPFFFKQLKQCLNQRIKRNFYKSYVFC
ncbi:MAG: ankyrin repeat domain-containing protein [Coxiellaceae bacterium]|nr:MAG: ankyrin repeat domain-containing protein [Coxiellaceae bacterium]